MVDHRFFVKPEPLSINDILSSVQGLSLAKGDDSIKIHDVAPLHEADDTQVSFFDNKKYLDAYKASNAGAIIVSQAYVDTAPEGAVILVSASPYADYARVAQMFYPEPSWNRSYIAENAYIHKSAKIGAQCIIDHNVYVGKNVEIGDGTWIKPNTVIGPGVQIGQKTIIGSNNTLTHCIIGDGVRTLPGVKIGQDGFGFAMDPSGFETVPQLGRVLVGNGVHIGANTTIDRGAGPDTVIGDGCRIDNLVQIGHNVKLGRYCVLVAQCGVSGSTELDDFVVLAGQSGVAGHLKIGKGVRVAAQSGLMRDVEPGEEIMGSPAKPIKQHLREIATLTKLTAQRQKNK